MPKVQTPKDITQSATQTEPRLVQRQRSRREREYQERQCLRQIVLQLPFNPRRSVSKLRTPPIEPQTPPSELRTPGSKLELSPSALGTPPSEPETPTSKLELSPSEPGIPTSEGGTSPSKPETPTSEAETPRSEAHPCKPVSRQTCEKLGSPVALFFSNNNDPGSKRHLEAVSAAPGD